MSQQFLDYPDVVAVLPDGPVYGTLHHRFEGTRSSCGEQRPFSNA